jgi:CheY-like chemotaxis protein
MAVASAKEALQNVPGFRPEVLLSDIGMPGEDGYSLLRRLRSSAPRRGWDVPAAALTAHAAERDRRRALAAGFQMHIPKPVEPAALARALHELARTGAGQARAAPAAGRAGGRPS